MPITLGTVGSAAKTLTNQAYQAGISASRKKNADSAADFVNKETQMALNSAGQKTVEIISIAGVKSFGLLKSIGKGVATVVKHAIKGTAGKLHF
ncbi:hypothetical protein [Vampirovibrio sp.]|uniref:hypothetical protein n=1 Tax=Vampirovibrio sp. TaxID=2717857 RepID=UPI0035934925